MLVWSLLLNTANYTCSPDDMLGVGFCQFLSVHRLKNWHFWEEALWKRNSKVCRTNSLLSCITIMFRTSDFCVQSGCFYVFVYLLSIVISCFVFVCNPVSQKWCVYSANLFPQLCGDKCSGCLDYLHRWDLICVRETLRSCHGVTDRWSAL